MRVSFFIFMISFNLLSYSQNKSSRKEVISRNVDINAINIDDIKFYELLDSLIQHENKCSYYSDTLFYGIWIDKALTNRGDSAIVISILGNSEKEFFIDGSHQHLLLGYFSYKKHGFFFFGRNILAAIAITEKKRTIKDCGDYYPDDDDRWAIYRFLYYDENFVLYRKENDWLCR